MSKYVYTGDSGMVPNIGQFETGQELVDEVAQQLIAAGYPVSDAPVIISTRQPVTDEGEQA